MGKCVRIDNACHHDKSEGYYQVMLATEGKNKQEDFC